MGGDAAIRGEGACYGGRVLKLVESRRWRRGMPILSSLLLPLHSHLLPLQLEVVRSVLKGDPMLAILPTGAGKSLCYQLPALLLPGRSTAAAR